MTEYGRLGRCNILAFVTILDVDKARSFYRDALGLTLFGEEPPFALRFERYDDMKHDVQGFGQRRPGQESRGSKTRTGTC